MGSRPPRTGFLAAEHDLCIVLGILRSYIRLPLFLVEDDRRDAWLIPQTAFTTVAFSDLEFRQSPGVPRYAYNNGNMDRARDGRATVLGERYGFNDLFVPVLADGRCVAHLISGPFLTRFPDRSFVEKVWIELTGKPVVASDPAFIEFVRMTTETPVLDGRNLDAHREMLELTAGRIAGGVKDPGPRIAELRDGVFARQYPHCIWADGMIFKRRSSANSPGLWKTGKLSEWERQEIGLIHPPDTVVRLAPVGAAEGPFDAVDSLLANRRFQREGFRFVRTLEGVYAAPFEDDLVLLIRTRATEDGRGRQAVDPVLNALAGFASSRLGLRFRTGIGEPVPAGNPLATSYRQATMALHEAFQRQEDRVIFPGEVPDGTSDLPNLAEASRRWTADLFRASRSRFDASTRRLVGEVLRASAFRVDAVRAHLSRSAAEIVRETLARGWMNRVEGKSFLRTWGRALSDAVSMPILVSRFHDMAVALSGRRARATPRPSGSLERLREWIEADCSRPWTLARAASRIGCSREHLSRAFKVRFKMGFNVFLQKARAQHAARLLRETDLPVARVARESGYRSAAYFCIAFRKWSGMNPEKYRQQGR